MAARYLLPDFIIFNNSMLTKFIIWQHCSEKISCSETDLNLQDNKLGWSRAQNTDWWKYQNDIRASGGDVITFGTGWSKGEQIFTFIFQWRSDTIIVNVCGLKFVSSTTQRQIAENAKIILLFFKNCKHGDVTAWRLCWTLR